MRPAETDRDTAQNDLAARLSALTAVVAAALGESDQPELAGDAAIEQLEARVTRLIASHAEEREKNRRSDQQFGELVEMVTSLAALDYSKRVHVHEGLDDSINALAIGLNMMAEELLHTTNELVRTRDQAMAASRAKSVFLANMSHELRTPLNAIIGYSEMLCEDLGAETAPEILQDLGRITRAARHLLSLIQDTLDLSKIEAERMELERSPVVIVDLVEDLVTTMTHATQQRHNRLVHRVQSDTTALMSDPTRLRQVLLNLLSNANKFTSGGTITLTVDEEVTEDGRWLSFSVIDTGIGIARDKQERVFEAFIQADDATTRLYGGTGLGLTISRRLCELMGGHLRVTSELGEGSTFVATLPLVPAPK